MKLIFLVIVPGIAHGCKLKMGCTECTSQSYIFVEFRSTKMCLEDPSEIVNIATILSSPNQCPTPSTTIPPSSPTTTTHQPPQTSPSLLTTIIPPTPSTKQPPQPSPSSSSTPKPSSPSSTLTIITILIVIVIMLITVAGAYICKRKTYVGKRSFARLLEEEDETEVKPF